MRRENQEKDEGRRGKERRGVDSSCQRPKRPMHAMPITQATNECQFLNIHVNNSSD